jgi:hypothetical protein
MIRLTVLYSLAAGESEEEFIAWRTSEHARYVQSMPGVIRNEFSVIESISPDDKVPHYRFQTVVDWPDRESFEAAFYNPTAQADLQRNRQRMSNEVFIVSEVLGAKAS